MRFIGTGQFGTELVPVVSAGQCDKCGQPSPGLRCQVFLGGKTKRLTVCQRCAPFRPPRPEEVQDCDYSKAKPPALSHGMVVEFVSRGVSHPGFRAGSRWLVDKESGDGQGYEVVRITKAGKLWRRGSSPRLRRECILPKSEYVGNFRRGRIRVFLPPPDFDMEKLIAEDRRADAARRERLAAAARAGCGRSYREAMDEVMATLKPNESGLRVTIPAVKKAVMAGGGCGPASTIRDCGVVFGSGLDYHRGDIPGTVEVYWLTVWEERWQVEQERLHQAAEILRTAGYNVVEYAYDAYDAWGRYYRTIVGLYVS